MDDSGIAAMDSFVEHQDQPVNLIAKQSDLEENSDQMFNDHHYQDTTEIYSESGVTMESTIQQSENISISCDAIIGISAEQADVTSGDLRDTDHVETPNNGRDFNETSQIDDVTNDLAQIDDHDTNDSAQIDITSLATENEAILKTMKEKATSSCQTKSDELEESDFVHDCPVLDKHQSGEIKLNEPLGIIITAESGEVSATQEQQDNIERDMFVHKTEETEIEIVEDNGGVETEHLKSVSDIVHTIEARSPPPVTPHRFAPHNAVNSNTILKYHPLSPVVAESGQEILSQVSYVLNEEKERFETPRKVDDTSSPDRDSKKLKVKIGPGEHDMVAYSALGVDYGKNKFERSGSQDSSGGTRSPRSPSKWDPDPNRPRPPVVNRNTVEKLPPPQVTQNVRKIFESGSIPDEHEVKKTQINLYESEEAGVFESKPIIREGVTRETDTANDMEALETGKTGKIASDWKNISADKVMCERAPIQLAEDEGCILETAPEQRTDVVREADDNVNNILPGRGQAASVRDKFINRQDAPIERAPIDLYDGGDSNPVVIENEPAAPLQEVIYQQQEEEQPNIQHGRIKNMANYFATKTDEPLNKGPVELCREEDGIILENVPIKRDNVIRECDDVNQSVQIERGNASSLKSKWENREEVFESKGFQMDVAMNGPTVLENEPTQRTDVVREDQVIEDVIPGEAGRARKIASRFLNQDESPRAPREQIHIERSEAPSVLENEPIVRTDVVKCDVDYRRDDPVLSAGSTRNKVGYWLNRNDDFEEVPEEEKKLRWQREIEAARSQAGVYENEPEENPEFEYQEEEDAQLPEAHTASMRTRWVSMQEEEERRRQREECPELVRFTPPRELTPPPLRQSETVQSYQTLTLGGATNNTTEAHESYPQQNGYADDYGAMEYNDDNAQTGPVMKSTTKISLRQS